MRGVARIAPSQLRIVTIRHGLKVFVLILPCFGHFGEPFPSQDGPPEKKVPLGARLKSTRQSHSRSFPHTTARVPELKNLRRGCIVAIRNWGGSIRATPHTPRSCGEPCGSVSMRPLGLAGHRSLQARRALVSLASRIDRRVTGEKQVCLRTTRLHAATSEGESRMARTRP